MTNIRPFTGTEDFIRAKLLMLLIMLKLVTALDAHVMILYLYAGKLAFR